MNKPEDDKNAVDGSVVREFFTDCAWLHRRGKPTWLFRPDPKYNALSHTTRSGTTYLIVPGLESGKPFWIGRVANNAIVTVERTIRAREIEFDNGGRYIFPKT